MSAQFDQLDANHDGVITRAEFNAAMGMGGPPMGAPQPMPMSYAAAPQPQFMQPGQPQFMQPGQPQFMQPGQPQISVGAPQVTSANLRSQLLFSPSLSLPLSLSLSVHPCGSPQHSLRTRREPLLPSACLRHDLCSFRGERAQDTGTGIFPC